MKRKLVIIFFIVLFSAVTVNAKTTTLIRWSNKTYATNYHGDSYWADTYVGKISICGADRKYRNKRTEYPHRVKITYDVQGRFYSKSIFSKGKNDKVTRVDTINVKDKWNASTRKTKAYANIEGRKASNAIPATHR